MARMHARLLWLALAASLTLGVTTAHATAPTGGKSAAQWKPVVPFIEDDFGRALALAKERKRPVFIEGWAPW
jgi:hypothetical protein